MSTFSGFDIAYITRLRNREPETEAHFAGYFRRPLLLKARRRLRSPDLVADACQETLLRTLEFLRSSKRLDHPERLPAFVGAICQNVTMEMVRSQNRYSQISGNDQERAGTRGDPHLHLITEERKALVREILAELPERDQDLLRCAFLREMDKAELCRLFGVNEAYLRVLLYRARIHFKAKLLSSRRAPV